MTLCLRDLSALRSRLLSALCVWAALGAGSAHAQHRFVLAQLQLSVADIEARNTTMARALFDEGLRFVDAENWFDAQDRFARVLTLRYSAVAAYNLGLAQARLGRGVIAAAALRRLLTDQSLDPKVRERTTALVDDVESHFAWLNVHVLGDCKGCSVSANDDDWPWAVVGVSVPVDAGKYTLRLRAGERILSEQRLEIVPGAHVDATLLEPREPRVPSAAQEAARAEAARRERARTQASPSILESGWFWGAMGTLVIGAATAVILETR